MVIEGPETLLQSCTGCLKSVEILQSFSLEKVHFSVNYVINAWSFYKIHECLVTKLSTGSLALGMNTYVYKLQTGVIA